MLLPICLLFLNASGNEKQYMEIIPKKNKKFSIVSIAKL